MCNPLQPDGWMDEARGPDVGLKSRTGQSKGPEVLEKGEPNSRGCRRSTREGGYPIVGGADGWYSRGCR